MTDRNLSTLALSLLLSQVAILGAETQAPQTSGPTSGEYILFGKSMFDYASGTNAYPSGGVPQSYSVNINFDGKGNATIEKLMGERGNYNPVTGKYDSAKRTISFITPAEVITSLTPYYTLAKADDYETLLCALNPYGLGYVDLYENLTFTFSEDYRSLYPSSGFGAGMAYLIEQNLYQIAGYDVAIYDALLLKKESGISFNIDHRNTDITNSYPGQAINTTFRVFNTGTEASEYVIGSSSPNFVISNPAGVLEPGSFVDISVKFLADKSGDYKSVITLTNEETDVKFDLKALCVEVPDYSRIVTEGKFTFSTDPFFPWILSDQYGNKEVAVSGNSGKEKTTSPLYADITVSDKHAGILSWQGYCDPYHPTRDVFAVLVDGKEQYISPNGGGTTDSKIEIAPGNHRIEFAYVKGPKVTGMFSTGNDYAWINNLSLNEKVLDQNSFSVSSDKVTFQPKTIVKKGANSTDEIIIRNEGWGDLTVTSSESDNESFSAQIPTEPIGTFETASVKLNFHTFTPGKHSGNITLHTSAGDVTIKCSGEAVAIPDYSPIVTAGEFDFDTSITYPFTVEGNKAYNSSSKKKDRKATQSMLQANFEVPEGHYGELSWKARVSTSGANGDEGTDCATIYIDGDDITRDYYGETEANQLDFSPASVNFYPGQHFVCFGYTQAGDAKYEGDDRIEVSDLAIEVKKMNDDEVRFWGSSEANFNDVRITKVYQREVKLANFGSHALQIKSYTCDEGFSTDIDCERLYNSFEEIPVVVTYIPETPGVHEGYITLNTTAGEMKIKCVASVVDDPETVMIEDFEDDWRLWTLIDGDGDGMTWANVMVPQNAFHGECALQSFSIHSDFTEDPIDDIALSPEFTVPVGGATLSFYLACYNPAAEDSLTILAGEGDDYNSYTDIQKFDLKDVNPYYNLYSCSLDKLAGRTIRIAFRHKLDVSVMSFVSIDDILVKDNKGAGVAEISGDSNIAEIEYFTLEGLKVKNPANGVFIRRVVYTNGAVVSEKVRLNNTNK